MKRWNVVRMYEILFLYSRKDNTMPLKKSTSKKAFKSNVSAEVRAGKPVRQAVAIAYSQKRAAAKGKRK